MLNDDTMKRGLELKLTPSANCATQQQKKEFNYKFC